MIIEIGKLNTVKEEIGDTANLLKEQLTTLTDITTKITEIDLNVNNSNMQLTELNRQFSTFPNGNSSVKQSSESSAAEPLNSISLLKNYIAGRGQVYLCLDAYVLRNVANLTSLNNHAKKMYHVMHTEAPSVYTEDNSDDYLQTLQTLTAMLNLILTLYRAAGLITLDVKSEESEQNLKWIMVSGKESDINVLRTALLAEANTVHKPIIKMLFDAK